MRNTETIKNLIVEKAKSDNRIRAVLLNGSRANPKCKIDKYQDFDIIYIVNDLQPFVTDHTWVDYFGARLIWQLPDEMDLRYTTESPTDSFAYLMLFEDGNRIDLTLIAKGKFKSNLHLESLTILWLDKDNMFLNLPSSSESDYIIRKPTEKEFLETCNEFWWVCTYVAKGLAREDITYAKEMLETVVRPMFMKMIEWRVGTDTEFSVSLGKCGKFLRKHISEETYSKILETYSDYRIENNWYALSIMTDLFGSFAQSVSNKMGLLYNNFEEENVKSYIESVKLDRK